MMSPTKQDIVLQAVCLPKPEARMNFQPRNKLLESTVEKITYFYRDSKISREMPSQKDTISVKDKTGKRWKLQKHWTTR